MIYAMALIFRISQINMNYINYAGLNTIRLSRHEHLFLMRLRFDCLEPNPIKHTCSWRDTYYIMNTEQTSENISKIFWCIQVKTTKKLYFMEFSKKDNLMKVVKVCVTFTTIYMIRSKMFFWFLQTVKKEGALRYRQVCDCQIKKKLNLSRFEKYTIFTMRQWFFSKTS